MISTGKRYLAELEGRAHQFKLLLAITVTDNLHNSLAHKITNIIENIHIITNEKIAIGHAKIICDDLQADMLQTAVLPESL